MATARWLGALLALQLCATAASAATRVDLNRDWDFRTEKGAGRGDGLAESHSGRHAKGERAAYLESRRRGLRLSRNGLVFPRVRPAQTTRGRDRPAPLRRHLLQGARVAQRRGDRFARGRLQRVFVRRHAPPARPEPARGGHRQPAGHVHHSGLWRAWCARCLVRLVGVRRHRARRVDHVHGPVRVEKQFIRSKLDGVPPP